MTKIQELKAALEAATPGEWDWGQLSSSVDDYEFCEVRTYPNGELGEANIMFQGPADRTADAEFIALAHNLMPALLEAVEALYAAKEVLDEAVIAECMYGFTIDNPEHPWGDECQKVIAALAKLENLK